jgi:DNA (cytosine-5)-methyltransferase 1
MISLFAGAGGLDIGLEQAGFVSLAVNELNPDACESLRKNQQLSKLHPAAFDDWFSTQIASQKCFARPSAEPFVTATRQRLRSAMQNRHHLSQAAIVEDDVRSLSGDDLLRMTGLKRGELFMVAGGPPCQPFSRSGKRETVESEDGKLFLEFVRIVHQTQPRWFLFENVKGLTQSKTIVCFSFCEKCQQEEIIPFLFRNESISKNKYTGICSRCARITTEIRQHEIRGGSLEIIVNEFERIGYQCHAKVLNAADYGVPQSRERLFIVGTRDGEPFKWPKPTHCDPKKIMTTAQQAGLDLFGDAPVTAEPHPWLTVKDVLWKNGHPEYGKLDQNRAVLWVKNVVRPHDEPVTWSLDRVSPTIGAHQGAKLALAPYGVPEAQLARQQWHVLGQRQGDNPPVPVVHAMLSDEELLRLQTFPQNWYLHGTRMERAFQIGNAVPPMFAQAVGQAILTASGISVLASLLGTADFSALSPSILTASLSYTAQPHHLASDAPQAVPVEITAEAYDKLRATWDGVSDEHRMQLLVQTLRQTHTHTIAS